MTTEPSSQKIINEYMTAEPSLPKVYYEIMTTEPSVPKIINDRRWPWFKDYDYKAIITKNY